MCSAVQPRRDEEHWKGLSPFINTYFHTVIYTHTSVGAPILCPLHRSGITALSGFQPVSFTGPGKLYTWGLLRIPLASLTRFPGVEDQPIPPHNEERDLFRPLLTMALHDHHMSPTWSPLSTPSVAPPFSSATPPFSKVLPEAPLRNLWHYVIHAFPSLLRSSFIGYLKYFSTDVYYNCI